MIDPNLDTLDIDRDELLLKMAETLCCIAEAVGRKDESDELAEIREFFAERLDKELTRRGAGS